MNIKSACGIPEYTNYVPNFQATLDYIFIDSDRLQVESVVPMPDHQDVVASSGLPSVVFPSDHIALICDLKFKEKESQNPSVPDQPGIVNQIRTLIRSYFK